MREYFAKTEWNNTLKNKTATECWNILKSEIDCVVDKFVPLKKQGKLSKKKHLAKEAIRKINIIEKYGTGQIFTKEDIRTSENI